MAPATEDTRCRRDILFYLNEANSLFTPTSYGIVSRNVEMKKFLEQMASAEPDSTRQLLKKILKKIPHSTKEFGKKTGPKRSAEDLGDHREAKKAKLERTRRFDSLFIPPNEEEESEIHEGADLSEKTFTPYEIEFGLTRGDPKIRAMFAIKFGTIRRNGRKDGSRIFDICKELKSQQVSALLIKFFRTPTKTAAIPLASDVHGPSEILGIIRKIDRFIQEPKTHKALNQMKLFSKIDAMVKQEPCSDHNNIMWKLAKDEVGSDVSGNILAMANEYRTNFHLGRKLFELSEHFGGTGIVFVMIVIRFGVWKLCHDWNDFERNCFEMVAPHLLSIRSMVECLGNSALEDYCRDGCLSEEKIKDLEKLKGLVPDSDDDIGEDKSHDNNDQEPYNDQESDNDQEPENDHESGDNGE